MGSNDTEPITTWYAFQCPKSGREYFHEPISGVTSWVNPIKPSDTTSAPTVDSADTADHKEDNTTSKDKKPTIRTKERAKIQQGIPSITRQKRIPTMTKQNRIIYRLVAIVFSVIGFNTLCLVIFVTFVQKHSNFMDDALNETNEVATLQTHNASHSVIPPNSASNITALQNTNTEKNIEEDSESRENNSLVTEEIVEYSGTSIGEPANAQQLENEENTGHGEEEEINESHSIVDQKHKKSVAIDIEGIEQERTDSPIKSQEKTAKISHAKSNVQEEEIKLANSLDEWASFKAPDTVDHNSAMGTGVISDEKEEGQIRSTEKEEKIEREIKPKTPRNDEGKTGAADVTEAPSSEKRVHVDEMATTGIPPTCWVPFAYIFNQRCRTSQSGDSSIPLFDAEKLAQIMME